MFLKLSFPHKNTMFRLLLVFLEEPSSAAGEGCCCHFPTLKILLNLFGLGWGLFLSLSTGTRDLAVLSCRVLRHKLKERRHKGQGREGRPRCPSLGQSQSQLDFEAMNILQLLRFSAAFGCRGSPGSLWEQMGAAPPGIPARSSLPGSHPSSPLLPLFPVLLPLTGLLLLLKFNLQFKFPVRSDGMGMANKTLVTHRGCGTESARVGGHWDELSIRTVMFSSVTGAKPWFLTNLSARRVGPGNGEI